VTSPEELIAAAHSSCFAMQFSALLGEAGGSNVQLTVRAEVAIEPDPAGGFRIPRSALQVTGSADGVDAATFARAAEQAKATCPVSKALTGVDIRLTVG
jgi:osmotically inducible protein OsmC